MLHALRHRRLHLLRLLMLALEDTAEVRVAISSFLASGGDGFTVFMEGRDTTGGDLDLDVLEAYVQAHSPIAPPLTNRIQRAP